jgi:hypothetical protein
MEDDSGGGAMETGRRGRMTMSRNLGKNGGRGMKERGGLKEI